jgi:hypothetical protein
VLGEIIEAARFLEDPRHDGATAEAWLRRLGVQDCGWQRIAGERGHTDVVVARFGTRFPDGGEPCLGILGVLGGTGMRPERPGLVSDADGAVVALAVAATLARQWEAGDGLPGRVVVATHICPRALMRPQLPAPMMSCPADRVAVLRAMLDPAMQAVLSVDASKANRVLNRVGFAITPTVKQGWILRVADDLLDAQQAATGEAPLVLPITMQDITPYGSGVRHINSIMQPATMADCPVVGGGDHRRGDCGRQRHRGEPALRAGSGRAVLRRGGAWLHRRPLRLPGRGGVRHADRALRPDGPAAAPLRLSSVPRRG